MFAQTMWDSTNTVGFAIVDNYVIAWFGPAADDISTSLTLKENFHSASGYNAVTTFNKYRSYHSSNHLVYDADISIRA